MALPTVVYGAGLFTNSLSTTGGQREHGPFKSSAGNIYLIGVSASSARLLCALKSADPSTTAFAGVGTPSTVTVADAATTIGSYSTYQVGDVIHVVTSSGAGMSANWDIRYHKFDMSTDTWTTQNETVKLDFNPGNSNISTCSIVVRSTGEVVIGYNGALATVMGVNYMRTCFARRSTGGAWTIDIVADGEGSSHYAMGTLLLGNSDRVHAHIYSYTSNSHFLRSMSQSNVVSTWGSAFATNGATQNLDAASRKGAAYTSAGTTKCFFSYYSAANSVGVAYFDSADSPTVNTVTDVTGTVDATTTLPVAVGAADGTNLWMIVACTNGDFYKLSSSNGGSTWGTPSLVWDTAGSTSVILCGNIYTRGGNTVFAFVGGDASPFSYQEATLPASSTTHTATGALSAGTGALSGSAQHTALHSATGTLAAGAGALAGSAQHTTQHDTSGALVGAAALVGTASSSTPRTSTGALIASAGMLSGAASRATAPHTATGTLTAGTGALAGTASSKTTRTATGSLTAGAGAIAGAASSKTTRIASGALAATGAVLAGSADSKTTRTATGVLAAQSSTLTGSATRSRVHAASGVLQSGTGTLTGSGAHASGKVATGALAGTGATLAGTGARIRVHAATGDLSAGAGSLVGAAQHRALHVVDGALAAAGAAVVGTAGRIRAHAAEAALVGGSTLLAATATRGRVHETTGTLVGIGALVGAATLLAHIQGTLAASEVGTDVFSSRRDLRRQMFAFFH